MANKSRTDQVKNDFLTLASHQLRTPISAIKWFTEMLLHEDAGKLSEEQREYIQQVYASNVRLTSIVDDMLMASNVELETVPVRPEPVDIAVLCHRLLSDQLHMHADKNLSVKETYDPVLEPIFLDPGLVRIILRNVLSNAVKYTPDGGSIEVTVNHDYKKLTPKSKGSMRITIQDTGYGIPSVEQAKVFKKLFRAQNVKKKDTDGTGLGLYLTRALVDLFGGQIAFRSKENAGSLFTIYFPLEGVKKLQRSVHA